MTTAEKLDKVFAPKGENKYGTVDGIQKHPAFFELTTKQQQWVVEYLGTGDRIAATHKVYPSTAKPTNTKHHYDEERASINMRVPGIRTLIAAFHGQEPVELPMSKKELAAKVSTHLRDASLTRAEFLRLLQYYMLLNGWHKTFKEEANEQVRAEKKKLRVADDPARNAPMSIADIEKALRAT